MIVTCDVTDQLEQKRFSKPMNGLQFNIGISIAAGSNWTETYDRRTKLGKLRISCSKNSCLCVDSSFQLPSVA